MAIYHLSAKLISRSKGQSVIASVAYRSAELIHDERLGKDMDYSKKTGVVHKEIMAPEDSPEWVKNRDRLWNEVENSEKRKDAQLAREVVVALPIELDKENHISLLREYVDKNFVSKGMIADFAVHYSTHSHKKDFELDDPSEISEYENYRGKGNPHAHILLTTRNVSEEGFGEKNRAWNSRMMINDWRESWAKETNLHLAMNGHEQRIDHRSYAKQGISIEPGRKIGIAQSKVEEDRRQFINERWQEFQEIAKSNGEKIINEPGIVVDYLTYNKATFTKTDVARFLYSKTLDAVQYRNAYEKAMAVPELVWLGTDERGKDRYTTKEMIQIEKKLLENSRDLNERKSHVVSKQKILRAENSKTMTDQQKQAYRHLVEKSGDLAVVEGYAGAGKSYMLGAAREAWESAGYRVKGGALAGKASEELEGSSGIKSKSLHAWEHSWKNGYNLLSSKDVFVIDEAAMVGTRQLERIVDYAKSAGAKVVLVHDTEQLQAIEAGAPSRRIAQEFGKVTISEIRRQKEEWQQEATKMLATDRTKRALHEYASRGHVHEMENKEKAISAIIENWNSYRQANPEKTQVIIAFANDHVKEANQGIREFRRENNEFRDEDVMLKTARGKRMFTEDDRIIFLNNDRDLGVKNGTLGTIKSITDDRMVTVELDGNRGLVQFDIERYNHIDHGYAATAHKLQGGTVNRSLVYASTYFNQHVTYVAMTRHEDNVELYWDLEEFKNEKEFEKMLSREARNDMAIDYQKALTENYEFADHGRPGIHEEFDINEHQKLAQRYRKLYKQAIKESWEVEHQIKYQPEVMKANADLEKAKNDYEQKKRDLEIYEDEHPIKARLNSGEVAIMRKEVAAAREVREKAEKNLDRIANNPEIRKRSELEVRAYNEEIRKAKEQLRTIRPQLQKQEKIAKNLDPADEFRKRLSSLKGIYGDELDPTRADWAVCQRMAKQGYDREQVRAALQEAGLGSKTERYVDRTVEKVFEGKDTKKQVEKGKDFGLSH